jgi:glycosyltransferase involved in cell wall biosynthesis
VIATSRKHCIWVLAKYATAREQGFETRTVALAREWVRSGREVIIITSSANHFGVGLRQPRNRLDHVFGGVRLLVLRTLGYHKTASIRRVLSWLHFEWRVLREALDDLPQPDIIIVSSLSLFSVLNGIRLARKYRCSWVFEVRDIWPLTLREYAHASAFHPLVIVMAAIERIGYRSAARTVGTMPNLTPHATHVAGRYVSCAFMPFGCTPASVRQSAVSDGNLDGGTPHSAFPLVIGYAGAIGIANALESLVEAIVKLKNDSRFRFVILGNGALRSSFMQRTEGCNNVKWIDWIARDRVPDIIGDCDILYYSARKSRLWQYGTSPNKLIDYLAAGKPVIASYSGFQSIINEARCGEFVPAEDTDALIEALERYSTMSRSALIQMGVNGRDWLFENRSWHRIATDYLSLLDEIKVRESR